MFVLPELLGPQISIRKKIGWHARVALLVATLGKTLVKIYKLHFFFVFIYQRWKKCQ